MTKNICEWKEKIDNFETQFLKIILRKFSDYVTGNVLTSVSGIRISKMDDSDLVFVPNVSQVDGDAATEAFEDDFEDLKDLRKEDVQVLC